MDQNEKGLLEVLIKRGLVPSFAFPLDVCTFTARESGDGEMKLKVNTSQDMRVALNSFVPGNYLTIDKKTYLSHGMTSTMIPSKPESIINRVQHIFDEQDRYFSTYNYCKECDTVFKNLSKHPGDDQTPCPICEVSAREGTVLFRKIIKPDGFAPKIVPVDHSKKELTGETKINGYRPMEAIDQTRQTNIGRKFRAKAKFPSPYIDNADAENQQLIWESDEWQNIKAYSMQKDGVEGQGTELVVANRGNSDNGWSICKSCGLVALDEKDITSQGHNRPYSIPPEETRRFPEDRKSELIEASKRLCNGDWERGLFFGYSFRTDLIFFRIKLTSPLDMKQRLSATMKGAITAIKESLITETTLYLNLVDREIEGGYRHISLPRDSEAVTEDTNDEYIDIFLFDAVSGGAGLVDQLDDVAIQAILSQTENRLKGARCHGGKCQRACIGCLLDFRNSTEHSILNRIHGYELLQYLKASTPPSPTMLDGDKIVNLINRFENLDSNLIYSPKGNTVYEIQRNNEETVLKVHFHSILTLWSAEGVINATEGFGIEEVVRPSDHELICCIPFEVARDSPSEVIGRLHQYFDPPQESIDFTDLF